MNLEKITKEGVGKGFKDITIIFNYVKDILTKQIVQICLYIHQRETCIIIILKEHKLIQNT